MSQLRDKGFASQVKDNCQHEVDSVAGKADFEINTQGKGASGRVPKKK